MQTSLQGIAKKAKLNKKHRFRDLYGILNEENLLDSWRYLNNKAASGVDRPYSKELIGSPKFFISLYRHAMCQDPDRSS